MYNSENAFGVWSHANQSFISDPFATPGDALIDMLDLLRSVPAHDLADAYNDLSVRKYFTATEAGDKNLSEFIGDVLGALQAHQAKADS